MTLAVKSCLSCTAPFEPNHPRTGFCSEECRIDARAARALDKRARFWNAFVETVSPRHIFDRDAGICHVCGEPAYHGLTKFDEQYGRTSLHPLAATIDHIVSYVNGGTHEPGNVAIAHFHCNSVKNRY